MVKPSSRLWALPASIVLGLVTFTFGVLLPATGLFGGAVNLIWGSVYGLGWSLLGFAIGLRHAAFFGFLVWPAVVTIFIVWSSARIMRSSRPMVKYLWVGMFLASLAVDAPLASVYNGEFYSLPLFYSMMFNTF